MLATSEGLSAWLRCSVQFDTLEANTVIRVSNGPNAVRAGRVVSVEPLRTLHIVWNDGSESMFRLSPEDDGLSTLLAFAHAAPANARAAASGSIATAHAGAWRMPSRHGLVAYTHNVRGDTVYLTQERWLHIRENHMDQAPAPRGKRTTTYWPTSHAVGQPSMSDQEVIGVIVDAARHGMLRTEVRDTRMAQYDLPAAQRDIFGVSEAKVSMAPDGLVLSAYPGAGDNVLAVYETSPDDHTALAHATGAAVDTQTSHEASDDDDDRAFKTNIAQTTFG